MTRKIARPTDSAGKVMWNAAVVANCQAGQVYEGL